MTDSSRDEIFLLFALTECRRAIDALNEAKRLGLVEEEIAPGVKRREWLSIFDSLRLGLQFAANVSKIFWPQSGAAVRGAHLRSLAELPDTHTLSTRTLRNHVEHMDERLDAWTSPSPRPFLSIETVLHEDVARDGDRAGILNSSIIVYEVSNHTVHVLGQSFPLDDLLQGLEDVLTHTSSAIGGLYE